MFLIVSLQDTDRIYFDHRKPDRVSMTEDGSLIIDEAVKSDSGKYICRASNDYGSPVVESAFIDIRSPTKVRFKTRRYFP